MKVFKETGERILIRNNEVKEDCFFTHDFSYKNCLLCSDKYYTINNNNNFFMKKMNIIHYLKTILTQRLLLEI